MYRSEQVLTDRLDLRRPDPRADLDDLFAIFSDPPGWWYDPAGRHAHPDQTRSWLTRAASRFDTDGLRYWTIRRRDDGTTIGVGGAQRQRTRAWNLNYRLATAHHRQGFATDVAHAAYTAASAIDATVTSIAWIAEDNLPSRKTVRGAERRVSSLWPCRPTRTS